MSRTETVKNNLVVILGPTSSGKTRIAVALAAKFGGEIVSADSRQVYRGMDVGTGKDLGEYNYQLPITNYKLNSKLKKAKNKTEIIKVPYHLIDVAEPKEIFDLAKYKKLAEAAIDDIISRGKLPILVGGSGLYLQAVVDGYRLANRGADREMRMKLERLDREELFKLLGKIKPKLAEQLNQSDRNNKHRLMRYLEIIEAGEEVLRKPRGEKKYHTLILGLDRSTAELDQRIQYRLLERLEKEAMVEEVKRLYDQGVDWKRLEGFGLEYRFIAKHLQGKLTYEEMVAQLFRAIKKFARRQRTWLRRWERQGAQIHRVKNQQGAEKLVTKFLRAGS